MLNNRGVIPHLMPSSRNF